MPPILVCPPSETLTKVIHWSDAIAENSSVRLYSSASISTNGSTELTPTQVLLRRIEELLKLDADMARLNGLCESDGQIFRLENAQQQRQVILQSVEAMLSDYDAHLDMVVLNKACTLYKLSELKCDHLVRLFLMRARYIDAKGDNSRAVAVHFALVQALAQFFECQDSTPLENLLLHLAKDGCLLDTEFIKEVRKPIVGLRNSELSNEGSLMFAEIFDANHYLMVGYLQRNHVLRDSYLTQLIASPRLIQEGADLVWPTLVQQSFDSDKDFVLPDAIWEALKKRQKECQEYNDYFKKITSYFNMILMRIVKEFKKNPGHYRRKLELILQRLSEETMAQIAWHNNFVTCITEARREPANEETIHEIFTASLSPRGSTASFELSPIKDNLRMEVAAKEHVASIAKSLLYESDIKARYKYKAFSIFTSKTEKLLVNIGAAKSVPIDTVISPQYEQKKPQTLSELKNYIKQISASDTQCVLWQQRSYIASQVFGVALKYLRRRKNTDKLDVMMNLIEKFSSGEITGKALIEKLNPSQEAYKKLAKKVYDWSFFQPKSWLKPKSARLVSRAMKNSEVLKIFDSPIIGLSI